MRAAPGAAAVVVAALRAHPTAAGVQGGGRAALANMAWGDSELRQRVLDAGAEQLWLEEEAG